MYHQIPEACYKIDNSLQKRLTVGADSARPAAPANSSPFPQNSDSLVESKLWQTEIGCSVTNPATRENIYRQLGFHRKHQVFHLKQHSNNDLKRQIEPDETTEHNSLSVELARVLHPPQLSFK